MIANEELNLEGTSSANFNAYEALFIRSVKNFVPVRRVYFCWLSETLSAKFPACIEEAKNARGTKFFTLRLNRTYSFCDGKKLLCLFTKIAS